MKRAYIGDRVHACGVTVTIGEIHYQDFCDGIWDIEFTDTHGKYRHWKQDLDGGEFIQAIDKKLIRVNGSHFVMQTKEYNGAEYTIHRINGKYKYLVTCREPYISRFFNKLDNAVRYAEQVIDGEITAIESTYNRTIDERYVYLDAEV